MCAGASGAPKRRAPTPSEPGGVCVLMGWFTSQGVAMACWFFMNRMETVVTHKNMFFWFTNLNGWCHKWKLLLILSVPGRTPQAAGSIISLGRWVCPGFWEDSWWGNLGETLKAGTGFSFFERFFLLNLLSNWLQLNFLSLIWLDLISFLSFF